MDSRVVPNRGLPGLQLNRARDLGLYQSIFGETNDRVHGKSPQEGDGSRLEKAEKTVLETIGSRAPTVLVAWHSMPIEQ